MNKRLIALVVALLSVGALWAAEPVQIKLNAKARGAAIEPTMWGLFFEDINYAADGGIYAELVKNRSFEFRPDHYMGWSVFGNVELRNDGPFERNPHYVRLGSSGHAAKWTGLQKEGFFGIGLKRIVSLCGHVCLRAVKRCCWCSLSTSRRRMSIRSLRSRG